MRIGWLLVLMLVGSATGISSGVILFSNDNIIGLVSIIFGTCGMVSYFICANTISKIMDLELKLASKIGKKEEQNK